MFLKSIMSLLAAFAVIFGSTTAFAGSKAEEVTYVNAEEARGLLIENPNIIILDVRTKGEYKRGHIEGAVRNNYFSTKFKRRLRELDRTKPYLVHCKSGHRSGRVVKIMVKEGFTDITHLDGGYDAWKKLPPLTQ